MQHDRRMSLAVLTNIGRTEPARHVQVDLQCAALPVAADGIPQDEFQLRAVKSALARIQGEFQIQLSQRCLEGSLGLVPNLVRANAFRRTVGELDPYVSEAELCI